MTKKLDLGPVKRWRDGDIIFVENDWIRMAYVETDDPSKVGTLGLHGPDRMCVEYIARRAHGEHER